MTYNKTKWKNNETWVNQDNMNNIEEGIKNNEDCTEENKALLLELREKQTKLESNIEENTSLLETLNSEVVLIQKIVDDAARLSGVK